MTRARRDPASWRRGVLRLAGLVPFLVTIAWIARRDWELPFALPQEGEGGGRGSSPLFVVLSAPSLRSDHGRLSLRPPRRRQAAIPRRYFGLDATQSQLQAKAPSTAAGAGIPGRRKPPKGPFNYDDLPGIWTPLLEGEGSVPNYGKVEKHQLTRSVMNAMGLTGNELRTYLMDLEIKLRDGAIYNLSWAFYATPLERITGEMDRIWAAVALLRDTSEKGSATYSAYHDCISQLMLFGATLSQSDQMPQAIRKLRKRDDLTAVQKRILRQHELESISGGVRIGNVDVAMQFQARLDALWAFTSLFHRNVVHSLEDQDVLLKEKDVNDLPEHIVSRFCEDADDGGCELQLDPSSIDAVLAYSNSAALRKAVHQRMRLAGWRATAEQTGQIEQPEGVGFTVGGPADDNTWVLTKVLDIRDEWAKSVGYGNFVEMAMDVRCAPLQKVENIIEDLRKVALQAACLEDDEVRAYATSQPEFTGKLAAWDAPYWRRKLQTEQFGMDVAEEARQYFSLESVLGGLFNLLYRLFGIEIRQADHRSQRAWHPSVRFYMVEDVVQGVLGGFYFDMERGSRKQRRGIWGDLAISRSWALGQDGALRRPVGVIVGDVIEDYAPDSETLLSLMEVRQLFRAMGRVLQEVLTTQDEGLVAGTKGMELDGRSFPERWLELWVYDADVLRAIGRHHETGEAMPESLVQAIISSQAFHSGTALLEELKRAKVDLLLHGDGLDGNHSYEHLLEVVRTLERDFSVDPDQVEDAHWLCNFEVFGGSHAVAQYVGIWEKILAADAFEAFTEEKLRLASSGEPITSQEEDEQLLLLGLQFREHILAPGGGHSPLDAFIKFRGREPQLTPFLKRLGLSSPVN